MTKYTNSRIIPTYHDTGLNTSPVKEKAHLHAKKERALIISEFTITKIETQVTIQFQRKHNINPNIPIWQ